ncbi:MAG: DUF1634 domain-containing protein [Thermoprotei archaeon]
MQFEDAVSRILRAGVIVSAGLMIVGLTTLFITGGSGKYPVSSLASPESSVNSSAYSPTRVVSDVLSGRPVDFVYLGLMTLIATPVLVVVVTFAEFVRQRNWTYAIITGIVLFNLMFAIFVLPLLLGK